MKRYLSLLVVIASSLLLLLAASVLAATWTATAAPPVPASPSSPSLLSAPVLSLQPSAIRVRQGDLFTLSLVISNVTNLGAYQATVHYSSTLMHPVTVTHPSPSFLTVSGRTAGRPPPDLGPYLTVGEYSTGSATSGRNGSGTLAYIQFWALAPGVSALSFSRDSLGQYWLPLMPAEVADPFGNRMPHFLQDATVTVVPTYRLYLPLIRR